MKDALISFGILVCGIVVGGTILFVIKERREEAKKLKAAEKK